MVDRSAVLARTWRASLTFLFAFLLLASGTKKAQAQPGKAAVQFLRIAPDSRAAGMGNSGVALADNANAIFWNPAGLAYQSDTQLGLTHANWLPEFNAGLFYEYLVGTYHLPGVGTFGGHVTFLNLGESERRTGPGQDGLIGEFRSYDLAVGASYGRKLTEQFAVGTGLRMIYSNLAPETESVDSGTAFTFAFDLSGLYRTQPFALGGSDGTFSAGFNLANMGPNITYSRAEEPLPMNLRFGTALTIDFDEFNSLTITNDLNKTLVNVDERLEIGGSGDTTIVSDPDPFYQALFSSWGSTSGITGPNGEAETLSVLQQFTVGTGLEYWYNDLFALRTGYFYENPNNGNRQFLTFGSGLRYNIIGVDISYLYALEEESPLANTLRFSLLLNFQK
jgi:hypothetical protein